MRIEYILPRTTEEKMNLMEFVYDNTDSYIMNTFGFLWQERQWWSAFPVQVCMVGDIIAGVHAFTFNTKAPNTLKTYYIITGKPFRGRGIAKQLTLQALERHKDVCQTYYVNSEEKSDGVSFYKKLFNGKFTLEKNQFGSLDYIFEAPINELLNEKTI